MNDHLFLALQWFGLASWLYISYKMLQAVEILREICHYAENEETRRLEDEMEKQVKENNSHLGMHAGCKPGQLHGGPDKCEL